MMKRCPNSINKYYGVVRIALTAVCVIAPLSAMTEETADAGWRADGAPGSVWRLTERPSSLSMTGVSKPAGAVRDLSICGQTTVSNGSEGVVIACERIHLAQDALSGLVLSASVAGSPLTIEIEGREKPGAPAKRQPRVGFDSSRASQAVVGALASYSDLSGSLVLTGGVQFFQPGNQIGRASCRERW